MMTDLDQARSDAINALAAKESEVSEKLTELHNLQIQDLEVALQTANETFRA